MKVYVYRLLEEIPQIEMGQRGVIGIDGLSRSGKTTFVEGLQEILCEKEIPIIVLHMDDYIVERNSRYQTGHEEWYEYYQLQWDVDWLKENMLNLLKVSDRLVLPLYDPLLDTHKEQIIDIPETCLIIIEGVFLQRKEWRDFFDYVLYLDCPRKKRFNRESQATQDKLEKFKNRYWKAEDYYLESADPKSLADMIIECSQAGYSL
jgi:uridine kinase